MKTLLSYITALIMVTALSGFNGHLFSQELKQDRKSKKEARKAEMAANFQVQDTILAMGRYVLEANYLQDKYGSMVTVSSNLNFIMVNGLKGVLQTGTDLRQGYNGVGGITAEGSVEAYKMGRNTKNLSHTITFNLITNLGTFNILMTVFADDTAQATISGSTSGRLTWKGQLVPLYKSKVYKGQQTY
jgi:Domain of unknown function (DUF4251)